MTLCRGILACAEELEHVSECAVHPVNEAGGGCFHSVVLRLSNEAIRADDHLSSGLIVTLIDQRAPIADEAPVALPARVASFRAPAPPVGEDHAVVHLEDAACGSVTFVPGTLGIELLRIDGNRIEARHVPHQVEVVDRHIEDQWTRHLIPESAETGHM